MSNGRRVDGDDLARGPEFERVGRIFEEASAGLRVPSEVRERAYRMGTYALETATDDPRADAIAALGFAASMVSSVAVELAVRPARLRKLIDRLESAAAIPRVPLGSAVLGSPQLMQLPTALTIQVELVLLLAFARATTVSLWTLWTGGVLKHIEHAGKFEAGSRQTRQLARKLLLGESPKHTKEADVTGVVIDRRQQPPAALIARGGDGSLAERRLLLEAAAPILTVTLERDELLSRRSGAEELAASTERRLARLRYDLHDGPQQDVILLGEDLNFFRSQLNSVMNGNPDKDRVLGRLDDLQARLVALDGDLRRISVAVESPFLQPGTLRDTLAQITDEFAARAGIEPDLRLEGDFSQLTDSQYITLVGLIREALSNIREHSDATHVSLELSANADGVEATVTDDGRGFDPEKTLVRAAREGHLGLVGMHERVRMLGGRTEIDSQPGGPTVISISLPPAPEAATRRNDRSSNDRARRPSRNVPVRPRGGG
jgi:signal transduction histidine kinase